MLKQRDEIMMRFHSIDHDPEDARIRLRIHSSWERPNPRRLPERLRDLSQRADDGANRRIQARALPL
jgi:hypothetical protein